MLHALCEQRSRKLHRQLKQGSVDGQERSSSIWQYACAQHSRLPQPYLQLCQALGCSSRAFLYVACSSDVGFRHKSSMGELFSSLTAAVQAELGQQQQQQHALNSSVQGLPPQRASDPEQQKQEQQKQQHDAAALLLLPSLTAVAVLHWAASKTLDAATFDIVGAALGLASVLLVAVPDTMELHMQMTAASSGHRQQQQQQPQQQQQQQPGLAALQPHNSQCEEAVDQGHQQGTTAVQWYVTGELLEQALGLISMIIQKFWVLLTAGEAAAAAAAGAAVGAATDGSSSCSSGTTTTSSSSSATHLLSAAYAAMSWELQAVAMQLKPYAEALHAAELRVHTGSSPQDTRQPTSSSKAWAKHMPLLLRPFEASTRSLAHRRLAPSCTVQMLATPLAAFLGPEALLASYWRPGASRDLDPQLISTCFSLLKALEVCRHVEAEDDQAADRSQVVLHLCLTSFEAVCASSVFATACAGSPADKTLLCASSSSNSNSSSAGSESVCLLPWLVLLGRCCLHWALKLQQSSAACWAEHESHSSLFVCFTAVEETCLAWLQHDSTAAELAAAGYDTGRVVAALQALALPPGADNDSATASENSESASICGADVVALAQQLHALGLALNTLAISCACNNPYCSSLEGLSELELVQGRARQCAKCRTARYCSKECQAQHWKLHKPACKALEAAQQAQPGA